MNTTQIPKFIGKRCLEKITALYQQCIIDSDMRKKLALLTQHAMTSNEWDDLFAEAVTLYDNTNSKAAVELIDAITKGETVDGN